MKQAKEIMHFSENFSKMTVEDRKAFMDKLPRNQVLAFYAQNANLDQLRELKGEWMATGKEQDWYTLLTMLKKKHSPYASMLSS